MATSDTFCSVLWNHQFIDGTGRVKPCCRYEDRFKPEEHTLDNYSIQQIFVSDFQNNHRSRVLAGKSLEGCRRCYEEEDNNKKSLRIRHNEHPKIGSKGINTKAVSYTHLTLPTNREV